jgi:hypothetical protein
MKIFTFFLIFLITAQGELCDLSLEAGLCLFSAETVKMPLAVPDKLTGHWTFDDDSCLDYSGHQNHCKSAPRSAVGRDSSSSSGYFKGDSYVEVPHSDSFVSKTFTVTFWMFIEKTDSSTGYRWCPLLQKGLDDESNVQYQRAPAVFYDREDKFLKVYVSTDEIVDFPMGEFVVSNARVPYYKWHHVAVVRTQARIRLYVNGIIDAVNSTKGWTMTNENSLFIGSTPSMYESCPLSLRVDDVRFYDGKELSESDVEAEAFGALGTIEPYYVRLGCINCKYDDAVNSCPDTHHLCSSIELHSGAYAVARAMGWTEWNSHLWSTASTDTETNTSGLGICCLNLD